MRRRTVIAPALCWFFCAYKFLLSRKQTLRSSPDCYGATLCGLFGTSFSNLSADVATSCGHRREDHARYAACVYRMTRATNRTTVGLREFAVLPLAMVIPEMIRFDPPVLAIVRFVVRGLRQMFCATSSNAFTGQLVLLCYKYARRQQGHLGRERARWVARWRRRVAMDRGLCRSVRTGSASGRVVGGHTGYGKLDVGHLEWPRVA